MIEIVKVQLPLSSNDPEQRDLALVYAEGRRCMVQQPIDAATRAAMGGDVKAFFKADYKRGTWKIGERVDDGEW
jgi:hypothetical protein